VELARSVAADLGQSAPRHRIAVQAGGAVVGAWDPVRLERVIANLVGNAVKYSPAGGPVVVEISSEVDRDGRAGAVMRVRDRGVGIPAEDLSHVFERFRRGANVARHFAGTGIGLFGSRQIVEQHGGTIAVESEEGVGSMFTVRLPLEAPSER
jgi:signal transduction histidine kinase